MHRFKVDKLIRDKLPAIMRESGITVFERIMKKEEYIKRLNDKLLEEAKEVINATHPKQIREELADLLEVIRAIACINEIEFTDVLQAADRKRSEKGGFEKRIYNAFVEIESGHPSISYYRDRPDQYEEIT
jgi:predicted house-cleaning noncanonical NTP pyrophosphatase (MazG superfamily)